MKTKRFGQMMDYTGRIAARLFARLRVGLGVFAYLMLGMSPAMADDIDIYTKNVATGGGGAPVIILQIDNSGSMKDMDTADTTATSFLHRRQYLVQDAARGQATGLSGRFKLGIFDYISGGTGQKLIDALALNTTMSSAVPAPGTVTYNIQSGADDVAQVSGGPVRFADGTLEMSTHFNSPTTTPVAIPANGSWTLSGGQIWDATATASGNKVYWYRHGSSSTTSQTITLTSTGSPSVDTYLYFEDAFGNLIAANDDTLPDYYSCTNSLYTELQQTIPAGEPVTPAAPRCARTCSNQDVSKNRYGCPAVGVGKKVYIAATYNAGNLNSTLNVTGLVSGTYYRIVAATYSAGRTGNFTLNFSAPTKGTLEVESVGPTSVDQRVGLMFRSMEIPRNATITSAYIQFQSAGNNAEVTNLLVGRERNDNPLDFASQDLYSRDIKWHNSGTPVLVPAWTNGQLSATTRLDVTDLLQSQVGRSDYCGGDSVYVIKGPGDLIARRLAHAFESNTGQAPQLVVTWSGGDPVGCFQRDLTMDIKSISEDVAEGATGAMTFDGASLPISASQKVGLRFSLVPLPQGVHIKSATLEVMSYATSTARPIRIDTIDQAIAKPFSGSNNALSLLPLTGNTLTWTPPGWIAGTRYTSPDISALIQPLVDNLAWEYDGTIGLVLSGANASPVSIRAWERHQTSDTAFSLNRSEYGQFSARLHLSVTSPTPIPINVTHRHNVVDIIEAIPASTNTPIAGTFLEAAQYMLGRDGYTMPALASGDCATNAIVFLTDGLETGNYTNTFSTAVTALTGKACAYDTTAKVYKCLYDMQDKMYSGTLAAADGNKYSIRSYGVGFGPVSTATTGELPETGNHGGGKYYGATNAGGLANVFQEIMGSMVDGGATVSAPGVAVNALNKFEHLDELYYALFKPSTRVSWRGNAKRYRLGDSTIEDVARLPAIDPTTARFAATSQSWWSNMVDGSVVSTGGVSGENVAPDSRKLYTYLGGSGAGLNVNLAPAVGADRDGSGAETVDKANTFLTIQALGVDKLADYATMSGTQLNAARDSAITWLRGGTDAMPTLTFGSAIHASPLLVNYGTDANGAVNTIFFGDNDGVLHMADSGEPNTTPAADLLNTGGKELFAFVPKELLGNAAMLNANTRSVLSDGYIYGLDGEWSAWKNDLNGDDIINGSDKVYLYGGMRRGGRNYFGFDVTSIRRDVAASGRQPILNWIIEGGSGGAYANMGQSWSDPTVRSINWGGAKRTVVFVSGGYDAAVHDGVQSFTNANQLGRQVYMVDAVTGQLLWWASSEATASTVVPAMKYSITSAPVLLDRNGNGVVDLMYVADLAGQVFRFDIREDATSAATFITGNAGAVIAKLGATAAGADTTIDNRRFYDQPGVAYMQSAAGGDILLALTSGYRERPTNSLTKEMAFLVIDRGAWNPANTVTAPTTLTIADLPQLPVSGGLGTADLSKPGWFMPFEQPIGEKGMGTPLFFNFVLLFSSYVPQGVATDIACAPDIGYSRLYVINALTGMGAVNVGYPNVSANQRFVDQTVPGLSSAPQMLFRAGSATTASTLTVLQGTFAADAPTISSQLDPGTLKALNHGMWFDVGQ